MIRPALRPLLVAALAAAVLAPTAAAQYFGRNKVQYDDFDFRVLETEHFDIYYYPEEEAGVRDAARMAERWYDRLSNILGHEFEERRSIIFYADDADFRQTNAIGGLIGEGVQGVTEGFKLRVVMPLTGSYADTDHVLGHELVHQFQYDISQTNGQFSTFVRLPLWIIEGFAEYLSVGREDPHTAMWLRDAAIRDAFPTLEALSRDPRYFPYRYGQAFWAYVGGTYGDEAAVTLFKTALAMPLDSAIVSVTGLTPDSLGARWSDAVSATYLPLVAGLAAPPYTGEDLEGTSPERLDSLGLTALDGRRVLARDVDAGDVNVSPQVSPDGRYVAFLSERDLFGIDLFLADVQTGQVIKKLQTVGSDPHLDALRFINSAGTWSPDGQKFAFVTFVEGDNEIAIVDVARREIERRIQVTGVGALKDPAWSPDGRTIAFAGIKGGISDLYVVDVEGGEARQLTDDRYADLQPVWSPDGRQIAFATDRGPGTRFDRITYAPVRLAVFDLGTNEVEVVNVFDGAKHINPQFSPDGESLYFVSDRGGVSNVYRLHRPSGELFQVTDVATGVSGITALSPTLSVAAQSGLLMYSVFEAQNYNVYALEPSEAQGTPIEAGGAVAAGAVPVKVLPVQEPGEDARVDDEPGLDDGSADEHGMDEPGLAEADGDSTATGHAAAEPVFEAALGILPPVGAADRSRVEGYLAAATDGLPGEDVAFEDNAYRPKLQLDYISQPSVGVGYDPYYGGFGVGGGIALRFSDMLGNNVLGVVAQANGSYKDIGGQVFYLNQRQRLNWGGVAAHIPYLRVYFLNAFQRLYQRTYITQAGGLAAYPLSQTRRFEANGGYRRIGYGYEIEGLDPTTGRVRREGLSTEEAESFGLRTETFHLGEAGLAYVGDYSFFGFTSPVRGGRYRVGLDATAGSLNFATATADYRRYLFLPPFFTVAGRGLHYGRYGPDAGEGQLFPLYLGYGTLVRGYAFSSFDDVNSAEQALARDATLQKLYGSRIAVANLELRMPLFGTEDFGLLPFPWLPTELVLFGDAGFAWGQTGFALNQTVDPLTGQVIAQELLGRDFEDQEPVFSAGASARINLLGALVLEFYYAHAFSRDDDRPDVFGVNFSPGW